MADKPIILALAYPTPEILPDEVREVRNDALICTGRSDYPNQLNNVLCFPYIFRGALDVGATEINERRLHNQKFGSVRGVAVLRNATTINKGFEYRKNRDNEEMEQNPQLCRCLNEEMKMAVVYALANLTMAEPDDAVVRAYGEAMPSFGAEYLIPKPSDPRLIIEVAPAVAKAAVKSGVATRPLDDLASYANRKKLPFC